MILLGEAIDNNSETTSLGTTLYDRTQANGMNLAVKDNLEFNLDPINMGDNAGNSWGNVILHGFNGTEYDEEGNVISGFSGTDFSFDGIDDYIELYTNNNFSDKGITIETYGHLSLDVFQKILTIL